MLDVRRKVHLASLVSNPKGTPLVPKHVPPAPASVNRPFQKSFSFNKFDSKHKSMMPHTNTGSPEIIDSIPITVRKVKLKCESES